MDDRANVGLVDAHAERVGRHHDLGLAFHEPFLGLGPLLASQSGMIDDRLPAQFFSQVAGDGLALGSARSVDDGRPTIGVERACQLLKLGFVSAGFHHGVAKVRSVKAGDEKSGITQLELGGRYRAERRQWPLPSARCKWEIPIAGGPGPAGHSQAESRVPIH